MYQLLNVMMTLMISPLKSRKPVVIELVLPMFCWKHPFYFPTGVESERMETVLARALVRVCGVIDVQDLAHPRSRAAVMRRLDGAEHFVQEVVTRDRVSSYGESCDQCRLVSGR